MQVEVAQRQAHQLGDAQARAVQRLEDGPVATVHRLVADHGVEQGADLVLGERLGQALGHGRRRHVGADVDLHVALLGQVAVQVAGGDDHAA